MKPIDQNRQTNKARISSGPCLFFVYLSGDAPLRLLALVAVAVLTTILPLPVFSSLAELLPSLAPFPHFAALAPFAVLTSASVFPPLPIGNVPLAPVGAPVV